VSIASEQVGDGCADPAAAQCLQPCDQGRDAEVEGRVDVDVHAVLAGLLLGHPLEDEHGPGRLALARSQYLELR
jgi:hypothetical protein